MWASCIGVRNLARECRKTYRLTIIDNKKKNVNSIIAYVDSDVNAGEMLCARSEWKER